MHMLRSSKLRTNAAIALLTFLLITGAALYGAVPTGLPDSVPPTASPTEFSSGRALEHVRAIAQKPHPMGSPENEAARDYLLEELSALGLEPEVQKATAVTCCSSSGAADAGEPENVLARLEGTSEGGKAFLVAAHYDSVTRGPGASDDGAGVAAMLETLRALKAGPPLKNDVIFLFTDGEEPGLLGAKAFVEGHPWAEDVGAVLNLEAAGNTGAARLFETSDGNGWIIQEFAKAAPYPFGTSGDEHGYELAGGNTDLDVFMAAGWAGMNVFYVDGHATHYHTRLDNVEELDERSLQHLGSYAFALTRHFGNLSLDHTKAPDEVYFNLLGSVVHYPERWVVPLMAFVVLLLVGVVALGFRRRRLSLGGIALGFLALPGSMIAAALGVYLVWALLRILYPAENVWALQYRAPLFWFGFAGLAVAITAALYVGFSKKIRITNLAVGALVWWLVSAVLMSALSPPGSYMYTWPLLFSLLGLGALFALGDRPASPWYPFAVLVLAAIPAVLVFAPGIYGVTQMQGVLWPAVVPAFAAMIVVLIGLLVPHLDLIAKPSRWLLPGAAATLGLGLLAAGTLTAGFDAHHPKPNNIFYALNADTKQAIWASYDEAPDAWTAQFLGADAQKRSVTDYVDESEPLLYSEAPAVSLEAPDVELLDDSTSDGIRTLRVRITPPPRANLLTVTTDAQERVVDAAVDGERAPNDTSDDGGSPAWTLDYSSPSPEGVELTLRVKGTEPLTLTARAATPGLPTIPGESYRDRPPEMMPQRYEDRTLVSKSFTIAAPS
jgi:Peptidase family M28